MALHSNLSLQSHNSSVPILLRLYMAYLRPKSKRLKHGESQVLGASCQVAYQSLLDLDGASTVSIGVIRL